MTGPELAERMRTLELTTDDLGRLLNRHQDEVASWIAIEGPLPKSLARELDWHLAVCHQEREFIRNGLPACEWMTQHEAAPPQGLEAAEKFMAVAETHISECPVCQRRVAFAETLPPLPPMHVPGHWRLIGHVGLAIERLPGWARPAAMGALAIGGLATFRVLLWVLFQRAPVSPQLLVIILTATGIGAYGGLIGGVAYAFVRPRTRHLGRIGDYVAGIACGLACVVAFAIPGALFTDEEMFRSATGLTVLALGSIAAGAYIGHSWFREA